MQAGNPDDLLGPELRDALNRCCDKNGLTGTAKTQLFYWAEKVVVNFALLQEVRAGTLEVTFWNDSGEPAWRATGKQL